MTCKQCHSWTFRNGRSECIRCDATADDGRGLPHGQYAINGMTMSISKLQMNYACPICHRDINPRMVDGKLRILCAGEGAHDIAQGGRAITKATRDYIVDKEHQDYYTVLNGLPQELRDEIGVSQLLDDKRREQERDEALPVESRTRGRHKLFKT